MFTVKVCSPGMTQYFETDGVREEKLHNGRTRISFYAQGENRDIMVAAKDEEPQQHDDFLVVSRIYLINDHGKTVDIFK